MDLRTPKKIAGTGGLLIAMSGVVNAVLGARIGAVLYSAYPGGRMGDVGIVAGVCAVAIGCAITFFIVPMYERRNVGPVLVGAFSRSYLGILELVPGHSMLAPSERSFATLPVFGQLLSR